MYLPRLEAPLGPMTPEYRCRQRLLGRQQRGQGSRVEDKVGVCMKQGISLELERAVNDAVLVGGYPAHRACLPDVAVMLRGIAEVPGRGRHAAQDIPAAFLYPVPEI